MTDIGCIVQFDSGASSLSEKAKADIKKCLAGVAETDSIIIDAYADRSGDKARNAALTVGRAQAVKTFALSLGFPPHRLRVRARGEDQFERPGLTGHPEMSRRVELLILR